MTDGINSRFLALEEKERASRVLQIKYIIRPTLFLRIIRKIAMLTDLYLYNEDTTKHTIRKRNLVMTRTYEKQ